MFLGGQQARAILIDKNRPTARRLGRVLLSAGYEVEVHEDAASLRAAAAPMLLVAEAATCDTLLPLLRSVPFAQRFVAFYGAPEGLNLGQLLAEPGVCAVLMAAPARPSGRMDIEGEILNLAMHLRGQPLSPLQGHLLWGAPAYSTEVRNITGREAAVSHIVTLCGERLGASRRVGDTAGEVVHELLTNAMYDAPVDESGQPRYARDRTAPIELPPEDRVIFRYSTDGLRLGIEAEDRFGRLRRADLARSLARAATGQINREEGGAGIGLSLVQRAAQTLQIEVQPGRRTRVTAILDLEPPRPGSSPGEGRPSRALVFPEFEPEYGPESRPKPRPEAWPESGAAAPSNPRGGVASVRGPARRPDATRGGATP